jgi:hypothetical protein
MNIVPEDAVGFQAWLTENKACEPARTWAEGKTLPEVWSQCENGDWLMWLLNKAGYTWNLVTWDEYIRIIIIASTAEYEHACALTMAEYKRICANTTRLLIPYPFKDIK